MLLFFLYPDILFNSFLLWYSLVVISKSVVYGSNFTLQSILIVMLLRRTLLPGRSFDCGHSMADLLIDVFSIGIYM